MVNGIKPIASRSMAERVEASLREYFAKENFKPGDPLPTELELAAALGVSRNVVREALSRFKMLGIIETKKKTGMVISNPDIVGTFEKVLTPEIMDESTLQDLFELRLVLEMGIADLLFLRKTPADLDELDEIVAREVKDKNFRISNEIAFHGKLYEMTGNETMKRFQNLLLPVFGYVMKLENRKSVAGKVSHQDLVKILRKGTVKDFKEGMQAHLQPHLDRLQQQKGKP
ncbi:DNA-binding FadR family transcriptional regulator [Chitinophaga polysaccharea]|uniref:DNA-binding FadR family transcriptional regulator n=1 Tax=Chitinophaga polysaccharea TaxID=1293035 RepID=A0A561PQQ2_9BACT|nr:GntR family transcriptional regulator [Chitinophaga polysaccharea]TWF40445.1 DNA-binding FadR family transcriptional regulator [Chitinophaga polysaccharea]